MSSMINIRVKNLFSNGMETYYVFNTTLTYRVSMMSCIAKDWYMFYIPKG